MYHRIIPVFNGRFTVKFQNQDVMPAVESIYSFFFVVVDESGEAVIVDTGFDMNYVPGVGSYGERERCDGVCEALSARGFDPEDIHTVVQTHIHWDHTGGMKYFKNADFVIQADEFRNALNLMPNEETYYRPVHWLPLLDRIRLVDGDTELKPGINLVRTGDHTFGHQVVVVNTREGRVVLGGDSPFNYEFLWKTIPAEAWESYRSGEGRDHYWPEDVIPAIERWMKERGLDVTTERHKMRSDEVKALGDRMILTHDVRLLDVEVIG